MEFSNFFAETFFIRGFLRLLQPDLLVHKQKMLLRALQRARVGYVQLRSVSHSQTALAGVVQQFKLADIGEGIAEVELLKWFVKEGDSIKSFDRICEVQSDKATVEITSRYDGKVAAIHHAEGSIVKVGSVLVDIHTAETAQVKLANLGETQTPLLGTATAEPAVVPFSRDSRIAGDRAQATPAVRKIAKENGIDLNQVAGSGPRGRILKEDVMRLTSRREGSFSGVPVTAHESSQPQPQATAQAAVPARKVHHHHHHHQQALGEDIHVPIRGVQRLMVKSMIAALQVQHLTYCEEVVLDKMVVLRKDLKEIGKARNVKISYMPIMIKAASVALQQFPMLNATVSADVSETVHHAHHNIGVAMDTPRGLIVPVIKHVQSKSIFDIAAELASLQDMAKAGTITESHLQGGTFTLSNIGSIGGTYAVPVLVVPQVAIGAFGRLQVVPRYVKADGSLASIDEIEDQKLMPKPSTIMNVSWSADHRVVDGATVAKFSNLWKGLLESPQALLAELR